jgi:dephospho-CoA kinase
MLIIGITGPSGSGKSAASEHLSKQGFTIIDADKVYHSMISMPSDCVSELAASFGEEILNSDGGIHRPSLAKMVFGDENKENLLLLNKIAHKYVAVEIEKMISAYCANGVSHFIIDAPLLIEAGVDKICDFVISVLADRDVRANRISERDKIDLESAYRRIDSQKPDGFYEEHSHYVLYNNSSFEELCLSIDNYLKNRSIRE